MNAVGNAVYLARLAPARAVIVKYRHPGSGIGIKINKSHEHVETRYSPEYQAICWAHEHDAQAEFFDLLGETVELATAYKFKSLLEACSSIADAAALVHDACQCGLMNSMELAYCREPGRVLGIERRCRQ